MEAFRMSLADVQENPNILSGTDLKYIVRNSPSSGLAVTALNVVNITRKAFNGRGVDMVMGARLDSLTEGLANILQDADVIQLGYNSGSLMSHNDLYSSFLRITPCSAYDGKFIAQNLQSNFGWSRLAVFSVSDDMDSVDTLTEFTEEAALNGLTVVYTAVYSKYSDDLSSFLSSAEPFEPRVILLLMPPQNTVSFLRQAYRIGLLDDGVTVMGTSYSAPATMTSFFNTTDDVASLMKGFIVYQPDLNWTKNAKGNEFMQRFHSWPDSISYAADGITPICHNDTDDEGWYTIHEQRINLNPSLPFVCSGIVPSAISAMEISLLTGYIYDGMQALARGLDIMVRNATAPLTEISAHDLKRIIVDSVSFEGVTGLVDFSSGRTSSSIYGYGDRIHKIPYAVLNFNNDYYRKTGSPFRTIGYINGDRIYSGCDLISDLSCSAPVYNTLDNSIPSDSPSPLNQEIPSEFKTTVINVAYLFVALVATCMAFIAYYRNDSALKALQPLLLLGTLTGCLTCCLEMIAEAFHTATSTCILRFWAEHLSFYLILGSITAKMYRIHLIVNATKLQRVIVSQMLAVYVFLVGLIPFVLYLIIFSTVGEPSSATFFTISITGQKTFQSFCTMKQPLILYILFSVEALVIIIATTLNVVISHAPKIIHEGAAKLRSKRNIFIQYLCEHQLLTSLYTCSHCWRGDILYYYRYTRVRSTFKPIRLSISLATCLLICSYFGSDHEDT